MNKTTTPKPARGGKREGAGRIGKGGKPVTIRLSPGGLLARSELAALWGCDATRAVEECLAAMLERAVTGALPPLKHRPALDGAGRKVTPPALYPRML